MVKHGIILFIFRKMSKVNANYAGSDLTKIESLLLFQRNQPKIEFVLKFLLLFGIRRFNQDLKKHFLD